VCELTLQHSDERKQGKDCERQGVKLAEGTQLRSTNLFLLLHQTWWLHFMHCTSLSAILTDRRARASPRKHHQYLKIHECHHHHHPPVDHVLFTSCQSLCGSTDRPCGINICHPFVDMMLFAYPPHLDLLYCHPASQSPLCHCS
jgi:hypothetical protein